MKHISIALHIHQTTHIFGTRSSQRAVSVLNTVFFNGIKLYINCDSSILFLMLVWNTYNKEDKIMSAEISRKNKVTVILG